MDCKSTLLATYLKSEGPNQKTAFSHWDQSVVKQIVTQMENTTEYKDSFSFWTDQLLSASCLDLLHLANQRYSSFEINHNRQQASSTQGTKVTKPSRNQSY